MTNKVYRQGGPIQVPTGYEPTTFYTWAEAPTEVVSTEDLFKAHTETAPGMRGEDHVPFEHVMAGRTPEAPVIVRYRRRQGVSHWILFGVALGFFTLGVLWAPVVWEAL